MEEEPAAVGLSMGYCRGLNNADIAVPYFANVAISYTSNIPQVMSVII